MTLAAWPWPNWQRRAAQLAELPATAAMVSWAARKPPLASLCTNYVIFSKHPSRASAVDPYKRIESKYVTLTLLEPSRGRTLSIYLNHLRGEHT